MFKEISQGFSKLLKPKTLMVLLIVFVLAFFLYNYSDSKTFGRDGYTGGASPYNSASSVQPSVNTQNIPSVTSTPSAPENVFVQDNGIVAPVQTNQGGYVPKNTGAPSDLLPKGQSGQFSDFNMLNQGNIAMPDLLDAGYLIGLDTIGQSLRNANYQERSDPIIPKMSVGPWNNSTIEPDLGRVPLEIGCGMR